MATPLFTRWFQAQALSPGFRLPPPAAASAPAPWQGPAPTQRVLVDLIRLRRRLAPYTDSTGADQAPAPGDSRAHPHAAPASLGDYARSASQLHAFFLGPSLWVQPAPPAASDTLRVALPAGPGWIDFWTGAVHAGEQTIRTPAPLDTIPLFVRAGSIVPLATIDDETGGVREPLDICVYPGADGVFTLLDAPAAKSKGARAGIAFAWDDRARTLRIGARPGKAGAKSPPRRFRILVVRPGGSATDSQASRPDFEVDYDGSRREFTLPLAPSRPLAPRGLTATVQGANMVLAWQTPCANALYRLRRATGPDGAYEDLASALSTPRHVIPLSVCKEPFACVVTAMNAGGESPPSAPVVVTHPFASAVEPEAAARLAIDDTLARERLKRLGISPAARPASSPLKSG